MKTRKTPHKNEKDNTELAHFAFGLTEVNEFFNSTLATKNLRNMTRVNSSLYTFFKPELMKRDAKKLLIYVLRGNKEKVLKIAKSHPALFFIKATAKDYAKDLQHNKRVIKEWSPYQALFGTGDVDMLVSVHKDLESYLSTLHQNELPEEYSNLADGFEMAAKQEQEKFPNGFQYPACDDKYLKLLDDLANAISLDAGLIFSNDPKKTTLDALADFHDHIKIGTVTTGHHFNMNYFIKIHEVYSAKWTSWNTIQRKFFSIHVIGAEERLLTTHYFQATWMGLNKYFNENQPLDRSVEVKFHKNPHSILGKDYFIDGYYGSDYSTIPHHLSCLYGRQYLGFDKLVKINTKKLAKLAYSSDKRKIVPSCNII